MSLLDMLQQHLGQSEVNQLSQQIGASPSVTQSAISAALPMLLGGMASRASQPDGASTIEQAIDSHQGVAGNISSLLQAGPPADRPVLLGRILGEHEQTAQEGVQQASGLDPEAAKKLLVMLSPIVLGMLAKRRSEERANTQQQGMGQLSSMLREEAQTTQRQAPQTGGLLGKILGGLEAPGR
jgi:hypothetical protein